ncbi:GNAT family N-acetyltransferase [Hyphococcus lacteus]|uniref:GNAT family N-acetyltransferase n=1 Tax=Hyphococcus lacteus TaxID=3143536 RepID=A0ABV3YZI8_9PROT
MKIIQSDPPNNDICTERLTLRQPEKSHFVALQNIWADTKLLQFIGPPSTPEEVWARLLKYIGHWSTFGFGYWMVHETKTDHFLGEVGVAWQQRTTLPAHGDLPEAGWIFSPAAQGQGFASEALSAVLEYSGSRINSPGITCLIDPSNKASILLAERKGFKKFGTTLIGTNRINAYLRLI